MTVSGALSRPGRASSAADVDGDGRDEVILGSAVLDDDGTGLWSTGLGHPDNLTVGDLTRSAPAWRSSMASRPAT